MSFLYNRFFSKPLEYSSLACLAHELAPDPDLLINEVLGPGVLLGLPLDRIPAYAIFEELPPPTHGVAAVLGLAGLVGPLTPSLTLSEAKRSLSAVKIAAFREAQFSFDQSGLTPNRRVCCLIR